MEKSFNQRSIVILLSYVNYDITIYAHEILMRLVRRVSRKAHFIRQTEDTVKILIWVAFQRDTRESYILYVNIIPPNYLIELKYFTQVRITFI